MTVLAQITAFNELPHLDRCIDGLLRQSHAPDEILIVDNASSDGIASRAFPGAVTLIRNSENRGIDGAVAAGLRYALSKNYEWMWAFDADSVPQENALAELVDLFESLPRAIREKVRVLASLPVDAATGKRHHGINFTTRGMKGCRGFVEIQPDPSDRYYECDSTMWSGSMFRLTAVREIGPPSGAYFLDWADHAYGYRGKIAGYKTVMSQRSVITHNLHSDVTKRRISVGPVALTVYPSTPLRCYYYTRNLLHFWLREYQHSSVFSRRVPLFYGLKTAWTMLKFLLLGDGALPRIRACLRGTWDGVSGKLHRRY